MTLPFSALIDPIWVDGILPDDAWTVAWEALREKGFGGWIVKADVQGGRPREGEKWYTSVVPLEGTMDDVRARYSKSIRRNIRKAVDAGVEVRPWQPGDLRAIREVLLIHRQSYGSPLPPLAYLLVLEELMQSGHANCFIAWVEDKPIAVTIDLLGEVTVGAYGASIVDRDLLRTYYPNEVLQDASIAAAHAAGSVAIDLGGSPEDDDTLRSYKKRFGAVEVEEGFTTFGDPGLATRAARVHQAVGDIYQRPMLPGWLYQGLSEITYRYEEW